MVTCSHAELSVTSRIVDGHELPEAIAGHRALEFCNTKALWGRTDEHEYLVDHASAVTWARHHGLITRAEAKQLAQESIGRQRSALGQLRALRSALYRSVVDGAPLDGVHEFVARAVGRSSYRHVGRTLRLDVPMSPTMLVDRVALDVHRLLEEYGISAVGLCAGEPCGWLFLDPTHRRRWCVMAVCGNRAKARRYAERRRVH